MRLQIFWFALLVLGLVSACTQPTGFEEPRKDQGPPQTGNIRDSEQTLLRRAERIHAAAMTLDTHVDIPGPLYATAKLDPGVDHPELRCDLVKMKRGGMDGVFLAVYTQQRDKFDPRTYKKIFNEVLAKIEAIHRLPKMYPDRAELVKTPVDLVRVAGSGKRAIMIGVENGYPVGNHISNLKRFYDVGVRYITLCHSEHNQICDSSTPKKPRHNGLSAFGKRVVREMNRLGIMVDVSHISAKSFYDILEVSAAPVIASHSGCSALNLNDRNLTDDQLRALAAKGGVMQTVAFPRYLKKQSTVLTTRIEALKEELRFPGWQAIYRMSSAEKQAARPIIIQFRKRRRQLQEEHGLANLQDFIDHIEHAVKIAGIDHVGIGTDFDGGGGIPGFDTHAEAPNVTMELVKRGYSEDQIKKIWGENLLRVWRAVERHAKSEGATRL